MMIFDPLNLDFIYFQNIVKLLNS